MSDQLPREKNFVHLHNHTEYSMLDGAARIDDMFSIAQEMGMPAIATTDHGYLFGAYEFWSKSRKYDVKPIIGLEAYVAPGTHRSDRTRVKWGDERTRPGDDVSGGGAYTHMTLLARNNQGMHNLFKMGSIASLDQVYAKWPRLDRELLSTYGDGLIATTGCPSGEVQTRIRLGQYDKALAAAAEFRDIFGAEHYFCELMDHGVEIERRVREDLLRLAKDLNLPLLATNDLHYARKGDAVAHDALLCINSGSTLLDQGRFRFEGDGYYVKSPAEMREIWRELPEACDNTLLVADMCEVSFTEGEGRFMPKFPCPPGEDENSWFDEEVEGQGYDLAHYSGIHIEPFALYSDKYDDVADLPGRRAQLVHRRRGAPGHGDGLPGDRGDVGDGDRQEVQHIGHRGAVEVAVGLHPTVEGDDGVVDGRGQLVAGDRRGVLDGVARPAVHLRRAAQGVGVLDARAGRRVAVAVADRAVGEDGAHVGGREGLAAEDRGDEREAQVAGVRQHGAADERAEGRALEERPPLTADEIAAWDIEARPDGRGLPPGSGSVREGAVLFAARCAATPGRTIGKPAPWPGSSWGWSAAWPTG
mgnify:CR=1 FL=1